jgi:UDP-glucuronate 4-epimerase
VAKSTLNLALSLLAKPDLRTHMPKNILLTGAAGFIGSFTAQALHAQGHHLTLIDNFNEFTYPSSLKRQRTNQLMPDHDILKLDLITDFARLEQIAEEQSFDTLIHLAAHASVTESISASSAYAQTNIIGTQTALQLAARHHIKHFIFASSSSIYNENNPPFSETHYIHPLSPYAASKAAAEIYCSIGHQLHDLPITVLRFFSVYGPWGRPDMAPAILANQIHEKKEITITRNHARDYIYIDDAVHALTTCVERGPHGYEVFNIASGQPTTIVKLAQALATIDQHRPIIRYRSSPRGEMATTWANITHAQQELNFHPSTSIERGCQQLMNWITTQAITASR